MGSNIGSIPRLLNIQDIILKTHFFQNNHLVGLRTMHSYYLSHPQTMRYLNPYYTDISLYRGNICLPKIYPLSNSH